MSAVTHTGDHYLTALTATGFFTDTTSVIYCGSCGQMYSPKASHVCSNQWNLCSTISLASPYGMSYSGKRFIVVCNGQVHELPDGATLETATEKAEALAHQHSAEAYIIKPVRKVAPKRDVVTTDL